MNPEVTFPILGYKSLYPLSFVIAMPETPVKGIEGNKGLRDATHTHTPLHI